MYNITINTAPTNTYITPECVGWCQQRVTEIYSFCPANYIFLAFLSLTFFIAAAIIPYLTMYEISGWQKSTEKMQVILRQTGMLVLAIYLFLVTK